MSSSPIDQDPWLAPDKVGHFLFCGFCTVAGYLACIRHREWRQWRLVCGTLFATALGAFKEIGDGLGVSTI